MSASTVASAEPPAAPAELGGMRTPEFVAMIAGLMALNALAIDIMLPALGVIARDLDVVSENDQQLVIFVYVLGFGLPQIVFGPLTDRFGRRLVLFVSLIGYAAAAGACMLADSFAQLLGLRFVQGVFASGCRVVAVSIVRDVFVGRGMARIMSLVTTVFMVVPILAPMMGQGVLFLAPWRWIFGALAIASAGLFVWTWARLPETLPPARRRAVNPAAIASAYSRVARTRTTFGYMCAAGVVFGALFAFIGTSKQMFTEVFGLDETFTLWFAGIALALSAANFTNASLVERLGMRRLSHGALIAFTLLAAILWLAMRVTNESFIVFFPLFAICFACFGLIGSNFNALAMEPLGDIAGTASAALGFATTTASALIGWVIGQQYDGSTSPVLTGYVCIGLATLAIVFVTERGRLFSSR